MRLTGDCFGQLLEAILDAFPTYGDLSIFVRIGMGENLEEIVSRDEGLRMQVAELITWADGRDVVEKLLEAAREANPSNGVLPMVTLEFEGLGEETAVS